MTSLAVVYVQPRPVGAISAGRTQLLSVTNDDPPQQGAFDSDFPSISADGRYVAFSTEARLDPLDTNNNSDIYVRDLTTNRTILASRGQFDTSSDFAPGIAAGDEFAADGPSSQPAISATGRYVAFVSEAFNLVGDEYDGRPTIVLLDRDPDGHGIDSIREDGSLDYRYIHVGRGSMPEGEQFAESIAPSISGDGTVIAWERHTTIGSNGGDDAVIVRRMIPDTLGRLSDGPLVNVRPTHDQTDDVPFVSQDGRHVVYPSFAFDPSIHRVLVADLDSAATAPHIVTVSVDDAGTDLGGDFNHQTNYVSISGDGRYVAFTLFDSDMDFPRVYVVDRDPDGDGKLGPAPGQRVHTTIESLDNLGRPSFGHHPVLSADGRYLAFATVFRNMHNGVDSPAGTACENTADRTCQDIVVRSRTQPGLPGELASPGLALDCQPVLPTGQACEGNDDSGAQPFDDTQQLAISADGGTVAYASDAGDLVTTDHNPFRDIFARTFAPTLTADPVDFGTVIVGDSSVLSATLRHVGFGPLYVTSASVAGANAGDFAVGPQTCVPSVLHEGETCSVSIRYRPTAAGSRSAELRVFTRGSKTPTVVRLTGGAGPKVFGITTRPGQVDFGGRLVLSTSPQHTITVTNPGNRPLRITTVTLPAAPGQFPGDYKIVTNTCAGATLAPGQSCQIRVTNTPHAPGNRPAVLRIDDTAPGSPHLIALRGSGATPTMAVSPDVVRGGNVTEVLGAGFPANRPVAIGIEGTPYAATVNTDGKGEFRTPMVIFPGSPQGPQTVRVRYPGTDAKAEATAPCLIQGGSIQPRDFVYRR